MKKTIISFLLATATFATFAGGILTNTNQNAAFLRNPARNASTQIDAVYFNPAGTAFLDKDGFYFSVNNQMAWQTRKIESTYAPFAMNGGVATKTYEGKASAYFIPSIQLAYKWKNWAFSGSFAIAGGGGTMNFDKGLGSFETQFAVLPSAISALGVPTTKYSLEAWLDGSQITYAGQLGVAYKVKDIVSFYLGGRMNAVSNGYAGYINNVQINPQHPLVNPTGGMMSAAAFFTAIGQPAFAEAVSDKVIDVQQKGMGFTPILGVHLQKGKFDFSLKYEFNCGITLKNKTSEDGGIDIYKDGVKTAYDIPGLLSFGASYKVIDDVKLSAGMNFFFDRSALAIDDKQLNINRGTIEVMGGVDWRVHEYVLLSAGLQRTINNVKAEYQSDMSFVLSSTSLGTGVNIKLYKDLNLNLAYMTAFYDKYKKESTINNIAYKETYNRTSHAFGIGIDYRF